MNATLGETMAVALNVNGRAVSAEVEPRRHLADFLRENLNLTGTHLGCEHGVCGACTLLVDGEPIRSCITFAGACGGADVTTIEGLDDDEIAVELRAAFNREHALQCGYCTPGMLVSARDLVLRLREPDERRIRLGLSGNLCRCTGYVGIVQAVRSVIAARRGRGIAAIVADRDRGLGPIGARIGSGLAAAAGPAPRAVAPRAPPPVAKVAAAFTPTDSFEQSFTVGLPPAEVFAAFGRIREIAECIPGAVVDGEPAPNRVEGGIKVRFGPISPVFRGAAVIERDEENLAGRILGTGADASERSTMQGEIRYRIVDGEAPGTARVELAIGYALKGALAQFGRPSLVRNLAGRMIAEFSRNLEDRLTGQSSEGAPKPINLPRLVLKSLGERVANWIKRLLASSD
ncbi:MAG TPA: 2Fe-2S iron-sulfur cluster-binding protein [Roseiarcus sp.]|jgi:carbon-monoxide dehydrogenase small subunit